MRQVFLHLIYPSLDRSHHHPKQHPDPISRFATVDFPDKERPTEGMGDSPVRIPARLRSTDCIATRLKTWDSRRLAMDCVWRVQDPGSFNKRTQRVMRDAMRLRYSLLPYLYTLFYHAHVHGNTVVRALFHEYVNPYSPHRGPNQVAYRLVCLFVRCPRPFTHFRLSDFDETWQLGPTLAQACCLQVSSTCTP